VTGSAPGTTTNLDAGAGINEYFVTGNNYVLDSLQGPLFLHGSGSGYPNNNLVFIEDVLDPKPQTFLLTAGATSESGMVQRFDPASNQPDMMPINYDGMNSYAVLVTANGNSYRSTGSPGDTVNVQSNAPNLWTIIAAGTGDTVNIGDTSHTLNAIQGDLRIQGSTGQTPSVNVDDSQDPNPKTINMGSDGVYGYLVTGLLPPSTLGRGRVWFELDPAAPVTINTGTANDTFLVHDLTGAPALTLNGNGGNNTLQGPNSANTWQISGANSGTLDGTVKFVSIQNLTGGSASDAFDFQTGGSLAGQIDGGAGTNTLDYSAFVGDVTVDLPLGIATAVAKGVANIQNVTGSQGNDLIVGDANPNVLRGGTGRSIIIGGGGGDQIFGGSGDNILIGGTTDYTGASGLTALEAILKEFVQPTAFSTRVANIKKSKGTLAGTGYHLDATNVHADTVTDQISGGGGLNWFFAASPSELDGGKPIGTNDAYTHVK
jgi:hypothetical protein